MRVPHGLTAFHRRRNSGRSLFFTDFIHAAVTGCDENAKVYNKIEMRELFVENDLPTPTLLQDWQPLSMLAEPLEYSCVLKASHGSSRRGVKPLVKAQRNEWEDLFTGQKMPFDHHKLEMAQRNHLGPNDKIKSGDEVLYCIEEFIGDEENKCLPIDYKCYTVDAGVALIVAFLRTYSASFLDVVWQNPVLVRGAPFIRQKYRRNISLGSEDIPTLNEVASRAQSCTGLPFVSVDCYLRDGIAQIGELTTTPGAPYRGEMLILGSELDKSLGGQVAEGYARRKWAIPRPEGLAPARIRGRGY